MQEVALEVLLAGHGAPEHEERRVEQQAEPKEPQSKTSLNIYHHILYTIYHMLYTIYYTVNLKEEELI